MLLSPEEIVRRLPEGWRLEGDRLVRNLSFPSYREAVAFVVKLALLAERRQHHPDLELGYRTVVVRFTTHSEGGVTERDLELAAECNTLI